MHVYELNTNDIAALKRSLYRWKMQHAPDMDNGTLPIPCIIDPYYSDDELFYRANYLTFEEDLGDDAGYYVATFGRILTFTVTTDALDTVLHNLRALQDYPVLDDEKLSELEYHDAEEQWESWGRSDAYGTLADDTADDIDDLPTDLQDYIECEAFFGFITDGMADALNHRNAADHAREAIDTLHAVHAYNILTCYGMQETLPV